MAVLASAGLCCPLVAPRASAEQGLQGLQLLLSGKLLNSDGEDKRFFTGPPHLTAVWEMPLCNMMPGTAKNRALGVFQRRALQFNSWCDLQWPPSPIGGCFLICKMGMIIQILPYVGFAQSKENNP